MRRLGVDADAARLAGLAALGGQELGKLATLPSLKDTVPSEHLAGTPAEIERSFPVAVAKLVRELVEERTESSLRKALTILTDLRDLVAAKYGPERKIEGLVVAPCRSIEYTEGSFHLTQGVKAGTPEERGFRPRGCGWAEVVESSRLTVAVEVDGEPREIWVDQFFKQHLGRLTPKRRALIDFAKPESIVVEEQTGKVGRVYYTAAEESLHSWLAAANRVKDQFETKWKELRREEKEKTEKERQEFLAAREEVQTDPLTIGSTVLTHEESKLVSKVARIMHQEMRVRRSDAGKWSFHHSDIKDFSHFLWVYKRASLQEGRLPDSQFIALQRLYTANRTQFETAASWAPTMLVLRTDKLREGLNTRDTPNESE
jgi:hypothetical protein